MSACRHVGMSALWLVGSLVKGNRFDTCQQAD
jgi:hypothetical protein